MDKSSPERIGFAAMRTTGQDMRYAVRTLRRSPGFTAAAVATLALAIGATTAMFSVLNAVLLRPLPYPAPEQLAMLWTADPTQNFREGRSAYGDVEEWRSRSESFADLAVFDDVTVTLTAADGAARISAARVSANFLPLLGVQPARGRFFSAGEAGERQRVALISHRFWQTRFGGSQHAIGASIELERVPSAIIGILPADFQFNDAEVWEPHTLFPDWEARRTARGAGTWFVVGRLRPGATVERAQAEMNAIARRLDEQLPAPDRNRGIAVVPLSHVVVDSRSRLALWMLAAVALGVLLIAAANVASLSLARGVGRTREMAVRAALGASPQRILRQLLAESVTLAGVSGVLGTLLAAASLGLIRAFGPANLARLDEVRLDPRVLGWSVAISLFTGILVGLAPALTMWRRGLRSSTLEGARGVAGSAASAGIRRALVIGELALAVMLLAGAGLLVRSWWHAQSVHPGFRPERVLMMQLRLPPSMASAAQQTDFYTRVLERLQAIPSVEAAAVAGDLFISNSPEQVLTAEGGDRTTSSRVQFRRDEVSPGFFTALGTPLLKGRFFSAQDGPASPRVAIINDAMARRVWPGRDPVGQRFTLGSRTSESTWFTVVGVVSDMRRQGVEREPIPQMFEPLAQNPSRGANLLVRTSGEDPLRTARLVQAAVRQVDKHVPLYGVTTLEDRLGAFLAPRRVQTWVVVGFAGVALLMAVIGIYGLIQYSVAARTQEIGIRMAVGAQASDIFRMVIGEGLKLSVTGIALGLVGALWMGHAGESLLFGVTATDPVTFIAVPLFLVAVALVASCLPARSAMKVEPIVALRQA